MKKFLVVAFAMLALPAFAQTYPNKPVRIIVPFAPGGGSDFIARFMAQRLTESLGSQVIVENKPGAGGVLGIEQGIKAPPDGYTLTLIASSYTVNPSIYKLNFDPVTDITPIIQMSQGPLLVVAHPSLPVKTIKELIALAKSKPGALSYGSGGMGAPHHIYMELFKSMTGTDIRHVPYRGGGPALNDVVAGHVPMMFGDVGPVTGLLRDGRVKGLGVTVGKRVETIPDVPTLVEAGLVGYEANSWQSIVAPAHVSRPIVTALNKALTGFLAEPAELSA